MGPSANSVGFPTRSRLSVLRTSAASGGGKPKKKGQLLLFFPKFGKVPSSICSKTKTNEMKMETIPLLRYHSL